jgi:hypothetical protein
MLDRRAGSDLSARTFADLDVIQDALLLLLGYTWSHMRLETHAITHH